MKTLMHVVVLAMMPLCTWNTTARADAIFEERPCGEGNAVCETISPGTSFPRHLRSTAFAVARSGKAQVSLQGSMLCSNTGSTPAVVDLVTQIVTSQNATPVINGPGGARHAIVLLPTELGTSDSFNLASTRVVSIPPGQSVISFNVTSLRMDPDTSCVIYNLGFSVVYIEG